MVNKDDKTVKTSVRMPLDMSRDMEVIAKKDHRSFNSLMLKILDDYIKKNKAEGVN